MDSWGPDWYCCQFGGLAPYPSRVRARRRIIGTIGERDPLTTRARGRRLFDDARELLNLPKSHVSFALITNGASDTQRNTLRILGIGEKFDTVVISGEVGIAKPDPSIFGLALQKLGVEPESAWHVGDSLGTDVAGALGAGLVAVWLNRAGVNRKEGDPRPDYEIQSLKELTSLIPVQT